MNVVSPISEVSVLLLEETWRCDKLLDSGSTVVKNVHINAHRETRKPLDQIFQNHAEGALELPRRFDLIVVNQSSWFSMPRPML